MSDFELVWDAKCGVAECPVWDAANRRLLFCDIPGKRINVLHLDTTARESWDFPEVVGSFGLLFCGSLCSCARLGTCSALKGLSRPWPLCCQIPL